MMIEMRGIRSEQELQEAVRLRLETFGDGGSDDRVRQEMDQMLVHPSYRPERVRIRIVDGRIVAHLLVIERTMRVGAAEWRMGGIAAVCTAPEARHRGHATALLQDALEFMKQEGFDVSTLGGIRDFYCRLGYAVIWPNSYLTIPLKEARALAGDYAVRAASPADIPALVELYDRAWRWRPGSLVRHDDHWKWLLSIPRPIWAAIDSHGKVRGYAAASRSLPAEVIELTATNAKVAYSLVQHLAMLADDDVEEMRIVLARDDPLVCWLRRVCRVTLVEKTVPTGGWMGRFIDVGAAMTKLQDELSARFLRSSMRDWRGRVNLVTGAEAVSLFCRHGRILVKEAPAVSGFTCRIPQDRLIQMVFGFRSVYDVAEDPDVAVQEVIRPLLAVLFPPSASYMAGLDWF